MLLVFLVVGLPVWAVLLALLIDQGSKFYHQCIVTRRPGYEPPEPVPAPCQRPESPEPHEWEIRGERPHSWIVCLWCGRRRSEYRVLTPDS